MEPNPIVYVAGQTYATLTSGLTIVKPQPKIILKYFCIFSERFWLRAYSAISAEHPLGMPTPIPGNFQRFESGRSLAQPLRPGAPPGRHVTLGDSRPELMEDLWPPQRKFSTLASVMRRAPMSGLNPKDFGAETALCMFVHPSNKARWPDTQHKNVTPLPAAQAALIWCTANNALAPRSPIARCTDVIISYWNVII